jgi:hypothetical protein
MLLRAMDAQDKALPSNSPDVKRCIMFMLKQGKAWLWQRVLLESFVREASELIHLCATTQSLERLRATSTIHEQISYGQERAYMSC